MATFLPSFRPCRGEGGTEWGRSTKLSPLPGREKNGMERYSTELPPLPGRYVEDSLRNKSNVFSLPPCRRHDILITPHKAERPQCGGGQVVRSLRVEDTQLYALGFCSFRAFAAE